MVVSRCNFMHHKLFHHTQPLDRERERFHRTTFVRCCWFFFYACTNSQETAATRRARVEDARANDRRWLDRYGERRFYYTAIKKKQ